MNGDRRSLGTAVLCVLLAMMIAGCGAIRLGYPTSTELLHARGVRWERDSTAGIQFYMEHASWGERHRPYVRTDAAKSKERVLALVGVPAYDPVIHYFIVGSRARMHELTDHTSNGVAYATTGTLCVIADDTVRAFGAHELFHVVAMNCWGTPDIWINEGMAVYSDDIWWGNPLHGLARAISDHGRMIPLHVLVADFRGCDDRISYPLAGSFAKFVFERYGRSAVMALWQEGNHGLERACGAEFREIEAQWHALLAATPPSALHYEFLDSATARP